MVSACDCPATISASADASLRDLGLDRLRLSSVEPDVDRHRVPVLDNGRHRSYFHNGILANPPLEGFVEQNGRFLGRWRVFRATGEDYVAGNVAAGCSDW